MIDVRAVIAPRAEIAADVEIGPYTVIGPNVSIGAGTWIGPHVVLTNAKFPMDPNAKNTLEGPVVETGAIVGGTSRASQAQAHPRTAGCDA